MNTKTDKDIKIVATNRKAWYNYHILSAIEAGIVLQGTEVKAIRDGNINIKDSYVVIRGGEVFLIGMHIGMYKPASQFNHDTERERKLLLNRREIKKLGGRITEKGMTMVPLKVYFRDGRIKVELALVTGKRSHDKRDAIAKRDFERDMGREWKNRGKKAVSD